MAVHSHCRICGIALPEPFLDLGSMPLANAFLESLEDAAYETRYPLAVTACRRCWLVQLTYVVPAQQLYQHYLYVSATSDAVRAHANWLAQELPRRYGWEAGCLLVEVASNDGTILKAFQRSGMSVLGVEPAANLAAVAEGAGIPTRVDFFTAASARAIADRHGPAACILGRHVFAHVDDLHDVLEGVDALLGDNGVFIIEIPYAGDLFTRLEFDTIYHEHLSYFFLAPIVSLCEAHGMELIDVDRIGLHGGSVILHIRRREGSPGPSRRLRELLEEETRFTSRGAERFEAFREAVLAWRERFTELIQGLRGAGARLIGYGAAAKGNTLLNYCPSVAQSLACIVDRNPLKHRRYTPGTHLPVRPVEDWVQTQATHMLILAWNFKDEIMQQMQPFVTRGGRFVIPIPHPEVV